MKRWKYSPRIGLGLCAAAWMALGATFVWNDAGSGHGWSTPANWNLNSGYPDGTDDDAVFPANGATPWAVNLIPKQIGHLTVKETTAFGVGLSPQDPTILSVASFTIEGADGDVVVTINGPFIETYNQ
jgi:hypothetical protein